VAGLTITERWLARWVTPQGRVSPQGSVAAEAEELMLDETSDWFAVVRFHDFELHV
jgi:hypothetical protein